MEAEEERGRLERTRAQIIQRIIYVGKVTADVITSCSFCVTTYN